MPLPILTAKIVWFLKNPVGNADPFSHTASCVAHARKRLLIVEGVGNIAKGRPGISLSFQLVLGCTQLEKGLGKSKVSSHRTVKPGASSIPLVKPAQSVPGESCTICLRTVVTVELERPNK